jgi:hypothetical protein
MINTPPKPGVLHVASGASGTINVHADSAIRAPRPVRHIQARSPAVAMGGQARVMAAVPAAPHAHNYVAGGRREPLPGVV